MIPRYGLLFSIAGLVLGMGLTTRLFAGEDALPAGAVARLGTIQTQMEAIIDGVAFSPDGKTVATASRDRMVRLWNVRSGRELSQFGKGDCWAHLLAFSPDGTKLAAGGRSATRVWRVDTGEQLHRFRANIVRFLTFTEDGKAVASGNRSDAVEIAVLAGDTRHIELFPDSVEVLGRSSLTAISPDAGTVVSRFRRWDLATNTATSWDISPASDYLIRLEFTPNGKLLASLDALGTVRLWETATGQPVGRFSGAYDFLVFAPDGRTLATGGPDGSARLLDLTTGRERRRLRGHQGAVRAASFSRDGKWLATAGADGTVLIWDLDVLPPADKKPAAPLSPETLAALWDVLDDANAATAYEGIWMLAGAPDQTAPYLVERLRPLFSGDEKRLRRLIADLDNDSWEVRRQAHWALQSEGDLAESALRRALARDPSPEARNRLDRLLQRLEEPGDFVDRRRCLRAVEALELMGTKAASKALEQIAEKAPGVWLKQAAKSALSRVERRLRPALS